MNLDELDKLAAEKVMGWHLVNEETSVVTFYQSWWNGTEYTYDKNSWQPSRNISQAWECLEKVDLLKSYYLSETFKGWGVYEYPDDLFVSATTAPEAIVRACLKVRGFEV